MNREPESTTIVRKRVGYAVLDTAMGAIGLARTEIGLRLITLPGAHGSTEAGLRRLLRSRLGNAAVLRHDPDSVADAAEQIRAYCSGRLRSFDLKLDLRGTPFQQRVWAELTSIGHGQTRTYGQVAETIGMPGAARAVGLACGANPLPLVVPCHRVVASNGALGGFGGGVALKRRLLLLESGLPGFA